MASSAAACFTFSMARLLPALHGAVAATLLILCLHAIEEDRLVRRLVDSALDSPRSEAEAAVALTEWTHALLWPRTQLIEGVHGEWPWPLPQPIWTMLVQGGPCGTHARVLARMLQLAGIEARIAQLHRGAHIVVVAEIGGRRVPLDPLTGRAYRRRDGGLASLEDVRSDWSFYVQQIPEGFESAVVDYSDVRYTNWSRLPGLGLLPEILPPARTFSIRSEVLNVYWALAAAVSGAYALGLLTWAVARARRTRS